MSLIAPYNNGLANKIHQALTQFQGQKITPYLKAQMEATVQNILAYEDPFNDLEVDVVLDVHGRATVNMKQKDQFAKNPGPWPGPGHPFSRKNQYSNVMKNQARLADEYVTFIHDPRDIDPAQAYDLNQFLLY